MEYTLYEALRELERNPLGKTFTLVELTEIVNCYLFYVPEKNREAFEKEAESLMQKSKNLKNNPALFEKSEDFDNFYTLDGYIKSLVSKLILKYCNLDYYSNYLEEAHSTTVDSKSFKRTLKALLNNSALCRLLSAIGYYQNKYGFFLSKSEWSQINYEYKQTLNLVNKVKFTENISIFWASDRKKIDPKIYIKPSAHYIIDLLAKYIHNKDVVQDLAFLYAKSIEDNEQLVSIQKEARVLIEKAVEEGRLSKQI